ncbi:MAG TPA: hypothetical protein VF097_07650 [Actinomycetota bacterium]
MREIEEIRGRLSSDIDELQSRMPAAAVWGKRAVGALVGGGAAATVALLLLRRRRAKRRRQAPVQAVVNVLPEDVARRVADKLDDERVKRMLMVAGGAWLLFKLAELRQLRRMRTA